MLHRKAKPVRLAVTVVRILTEYQNTNGIQWCVRQGTKDIFGGREDFVSLPFVVHKLREFSEVLSRQLVG